MKRLLSLALFGVLAAASVSAQTRFDRLGDTPDRAPGLRPNAAQQNAPPITNPEPITLIALAGGAAAAGGLLRRRKQAQ